MLGETDDTSDSEFEHVPLSGGSETEDKKVHVAGAVDTMEDSSDDDEPIVCRKPSGRANLSVLDDSDDDSQPPASAPVGKPTDDAGSSDEDMEAERSDEGQPKDDDTDDESDKENTPIVNTGGKSRVTQSGEDSDETNSEDEEERLPLKSKKAKSGSMLRDDSDEDSNSSEHPPENARSLVQSDSESDGEDRLPLSSKKRTPGLTDDLFDADGDSDKDGPAKAAGDSSSESSEDEDDSAPVLSEALRKKLAKGAAKKEKASSSRTPRPQKEDVQMIHSETQRLVRESDVRLPYHKPQRLGLSVFLARTQQKQAQLQQVLKHSPVCTWKTAPGLAAQPPLQRLPDTQSRSQNSQDTGTESINSQAAEDTLPDVESLRSRATARLNSSLAADIEVNNDGDTSKDDTQTNVGDEQTENSGVSNSTAQVSEDPCAMEINEDELPDLLIETESKPVESNSQNEEQSAIENELVNAQDDNTDMKTTTEGPDCNDEGGKEKTDDGDVVEKPEQDSGFLTAPNSEEENSGDKPVEEGTTSPKKTTPPSRHLPPSLTPRLAGLGLEKFTPKLSGEPADFIDLDEDEETKTVSKAPGMIDLMDRLVKHSTKRKNKARDVQLSTVRKEWVDNHEELQVEHVTVHLDGDTPVDPNLETPGAKLLYLKERLKGQMKARRQEAREQREDTEGMEEEEGFEEEEELSEKSDTDVEEDVDEEEEEEEDDGAEIQQEEEREANPFLDEEAEDDEDEDMEEGDMNLQLDLGEDSDGEEEEIEGVKPAQDFLKSALQKNKTMQLFDDDAMSESPGTSQPDKASTQSSDISDRPFEQLSQGTQSKLDDCHKGNLTGGSSIEQTSLGDLDKELSVHSADTVSTTDTVDTSLDMSSLIPAGQTTSRKNGSSFFDGRNTPDLFTPSSKGSITTSLGSTSKHIRPASSLSSLALPIEDSQDLLCGNSMPSSQAESTPKIHTAPFRFNSEDSETHSQLLDADGLFRDKSFDKNHARRQLKLDSTSNSNMDNMDELLDLCSGNFATGGASQSGAKPAGFFGMSQLSQDAPEGDNMDELLGLCSGRFTGVGAEASNDGLASQTNTQSNMDELMGLCSGKFTATDSPMEKRGKKRKPAEDEEEEEDFEVDEDAGREEDEYEEEEVLSDEEAGYDDEEDEEMQLAKQLFSGKKGKINKNFVDEEAELSGSEAESDEDFDIAEGDDILEREEGDDEELPSDDELRDQVGRVHLKALIDDDKRQLRLYQEMYLADGDLHSEGNGRQRKFRWKNIDDEDTQQDMFHNSDEEAENDEQENIAETKWRMERFEREKFLAEQKAKEEGQQEEQEGSQLVRLGKVVFKQRQNKVVEPEAEPEKEESSKPTSKKKGAAPAPKSIFKVPNCHGSFLRRDKDSLAKIAELNKPMGNLNGARNRGTFVFSTLSPSEPEEKKAKPKRPPAAQRSTSVPASQPAKKPRLEKKSQSMPQGSIFNLM